MKTVIVAVNSKYIHSSLAPWCLVAGVERYSKEKHFVEIAEGTINQNPGDILEKIFEYAPECVAFSCYIWNISVIKELIKRTAEKLPDAAIVLGGPEAAFNAEALMKELPDVYAVIAGEGEVSFARLLDALEQGEQNPEIPGLFHRGASGKIIGSAPCHGEEEPPSPYTPRYFQTLKGRIAYLETSRGCPFSCSFCLSGAEKGVRFFDMERAKRELIMLAESGTKTVKLVDRTFNCHSERAYELLKFIVEWAKTNGEKQVRFHFEVGADLFDEKMLALIVSAPKGLFQFEAGLQSFQPETLNAVSRKTDLRKLTANLQKLLDPGNVHVHIDLIAGLPFEDFKGFASSFNQAYGLTPHMLQLGFLKMLHGSRIRTQADSFDYRYREMPPYEIISNRWISEKELGILRRIEDSVERLYNSGRFLLTLRYLMEVTKSEPFAFFRAVSKYVCDNFDTSNISLDCYTERLYPYFSGVPGVNPAELRDMMVCDRLSTDNTGRLPSCLRRKDSRLSVLKRIYGVRGVKMGFAVLYSKEERGIVADYREKDPVTGRTPLRVCELPEG